MDNTKTVSYGPGLVTLTTLVFVIAKLSGHFPYSWWIVFAPVWLSAIATVVIIAIVLAVIGLVAAFSD